jgi:hypothetical protein
MKARILAMFLALVMAVTLLPMSVSAEPESPFNCDCAEVGDCLWCCRCGRLEPDICRTCFVYLPGDVDGDGKLSMNDAFLILRSLTTRTQYFNENIHALIAAISIDRLGRESQLQGIFPSFEHMLHAIEAGRTGSRPYVTDYLQIMRRFIGLRTVVLDDVWGDEDLQHVFFQSPGLSLQADICTTRNSVIYRTATAFPGGELFSFAFNNPIRVHSAEAATQDTPIVGIRVSEALVHNNQTTRIQVLGGFSPSEIPAGSVIAFQRTGAVAPEDFSLHSDHAEGDIVWDFCRECCGGRFGFGNVTGGNRPGVQDALAILRSVVGLPSRLSK